MGTLPAAHGRRPGSEPSLSPGPCDPWTLVTFLNTCSLGLVKQCGPPRLPHTAKGTFSVPRMPPHGLAGCLVNRSPGRQGNGRAGQSPGGVLGCAPLPCPPASWPRPVIQQTLPHSSRRSCREQALPSTNPPELKLGPVGVVPSCDPGHAACSLACSSACPPTSRCARGLSAGHSSTVLKTTACQMFLLEGGSWGSAGESPGARETAAGWRGPRTEQTRHGSPRGCEVTGGKGACAAAKETLRIGALNTWIKKMWKIYVFTGRTDAEAETPILWPPDAKN